MPKRPDWFCTINEPGTITAKSRQRRGAGKATILQRHATGMVAVLETVNCETDAKTGGIGAFFRRSHEMTHETGAYPETSGWTFRPPDATFRPPGETVGVMS